MRTRVQGRGRAAMATGVLLLGVWAGSMAGPAGAADPVAPKGGPAAGDPRARLVARGKYLVAIMDCGGCHTPGALAGKPEMNRYLGGSDIGFGLPGAGVVYPKNLTPDPETGLGRWAADDIVRALRQGRSKDGRTLIPIMPWPAYAALTDADARAIVAYLKSVPAIRHQVPPDAKEGEKAPAPYLGVIMP
jgi:mono/diheme cytochrome c family protein